MITTGYRRSPLALPYGRITVIKIKNP